MISTSGDPAGPVPRPLAVTCALLLAASVVMIFVGGLRTGVTWDEPYHVQRYNNYLDTGWYVTDAQRTGDRPGSEVTDQFVYAPVTMIGLHGLGIVAGVDGSDAVTTTSDAYRVRHVGIGLVALLGLAAVAATARLLFGRWDWALVSSTALAVLPLWTGHSMFNLKDVPVATGYALATLGLALTARAERGRLAASVAASGSWGLGVFLAVGTRPGMWTAMLASATVLLACLGLREHSSRRRGNRGHGNSWRYVEVAGGVAAAAVALWMVYPKVFGDPLDVLYRSAVGSANFLGVHAPWTFVPIRVFLQVPSVLLAFFGVGVAFSVASLLRARLDLGVSETRQLLLLVQVFTLPTIAIVHRANLYGDLRQLLFATPATMVIAVLGIQRLTDHARTKGDRYGPPLVSLAAAGGLIAPLIGQAQLFPYNYTYYNALTAVGDITTDGDYYRASGRALVEQVPAGARVVCSPEVDEQGRAMRLAHLDGYVDCASAVSSPISAYLDGVPGSSAPSSEYFWALTFNGRGDVPDNCDRKASVSRRTLLRRLPMSTLSRCRLEFPVLTDDVVVISKEKPSLAFPDLGWFIPTSDGTEQGVRSMGGPSTMTFRLEERLAGGPAVLEVVLEKPARPDVMFAGNRVEYVSIGGSRPRLDISLPATLVSRAVTTPQSLTFTSSTSEPLDLKVMSIRAVGDSR